MYKNESNTSVDLHQEYKSGLKIENIGHLL